jgi:hypothetical protein
MRVPDSGTFDPLAGSLAANFLHERVNEAKSRWQPQRWRDERSRLAVAKGSFHSVLQGDS